MTIQKIFKKKNNALSFFIKLINNIEIHMYYFL